MKNSLLLLLIILIAVLGGMGLFYLESRLPDRELSDRDISAQLLKIDSLDSSINELALRSRSNLDANYDMLVRNTLSMERTIDNLADTHFNSDKIAGSLLESRFVTFQNAIETKLEQVENFKSNNSVLRNSDQYAPIIGIQLAQIAASTGQAEVRNLYQTAVIDLLEFTKQGSSKSDVDVIGYHGQIIASQAAMPKESEIGILEFANHFKTAIQARKSTDQYLNSVLNSTANDQIEDIFSAWSVWRAENGSAREVLRYYTIAYVVAMLGLIGMLVFRLRSLYQNLDAEVEIKTQEAKKAYDELRESESQLAQNEKMAALGQLVAGVAHEINTPMGYVDSNVETVHRRLLKLEPVLKTVEELSRAASDQQREKTTITELVKKQIASYRKLGKSAEVSKVLELLVDTKDGLLEMQETVKSLTNFSHVEDAPRQRVDINERIEKAIKVCNPQLQGRRVVTRFGGNLPLISGISNQLSQVLINIINNAVHATDSETGVITIESLLIADKVRVSVHDNGVGIAEKLQKRIFDPFFTTRAVGEGTGLGLSIAYQITKAHEGTLIVTSEVDEGTSVTIEFPSIKEQPNHGQLGIRVVK